MAAVSADLVARYRDERLAAGKSNNTNTVRIELAMQCSGSPSPDGRRIGLAWLLLGRI